MKSICLLASENRPWWLTGFPLGDLGGRNFLSAGDDALLARAGALSF